MESKCKRVHSILILFFFGVAFSVFQYTRQHEIGINVKLSLRRHSVYFPQQNEKLEGLHQLEHQSSQLWKNGEYEYGGNLAGKEKVDVVVAVFSLPSEKHSEFRRKQREWYTLQYPQGKIYNTYSHARRDRRNNQSETAAEVNSIYTSRTFWTYKLIFVVESDHADREAILDGDILYVNVPGGFGNIWYKTQALFTQINRFFDFKYVLKTDDDALVCLNRYLETTENSLSEEARDFAYTGYLTRCGKIHRYPKDRYYDKAFLKESMGILNCYPPYMQGLGYMLGKKLTESLQHATWAPIKNEDAAIGILTFGMRREIVNIHGKKAFLHPIEKTRSNYKGLLKCYGNSD